MATNMVPKGVTKEVKIEMLRSQMDLEHRRLDRLQESLAASKAILAEYDADGMKSSALRMAAQVKRQQKQVNDCSAGLAEMNQAYSVLTGRVKI